MDREHEDDIAPEVSEDSETETASYPNAGVDLEEDEPRENRSDGESEPGGEEDDEDDHSDSI